VLHPDELCPLEAYFLDSYVLPNGGDLVQARALAETWQATGLWDDAQAIDWLEACPGISPTTAMALELAGITPEQAIERVWQGRRVQDRPPLWRRVVAGDLSAPAAREELRQASGT
jgi:hypothetical protein